MLKEEFQKKITALPWILGRKGIGIYVISISYINYIEVIKVEFEVWKFMDVRVKVKLVVDNIDKWFGDPKYFNILIERIIKSIEKKEQKILLNEL